MVALAPFEDRFEDCSSPHSNWALMYTPLSASPCWIITALASYENCFVDCNLTNTIQFCSPITMLMHVMLICGCYIGNHLYCSPSASAWGIWLVWWCAAHGWGHNPVPWAKSRHCAVLWELWIQVSRKKGCSWFPSRSHLQEGSGKICAIASCFCQQY